MRLVRAFDFCFYLFLITMACCSPLPAQQPAAGSGAILFEGARLIVGDGSPPIEHSAFIIENGKFAHVGHKGQIRLPKGAARIDLTGKTVMPAIIDAHSHLGYFNERANPDLWTNYTRENLTENLRRMPYYGVRVT